MKSLWRLVVFGPVLAVLILILYALVKYVFFGEALLHVYQYAALLAFIAVWLVICAIVAGLKWCAEENRK